MRAFFVALSSSKLMNWLFVRFALARRLARRFIAGESLDDALSVVRRLNAEGKDATVNFLGEGVSSRDDARRVVAYYKKILLRIKEEGLKATVSIKPTHMGLGFGQEVFRENLEDLLKTATHVGNTVEVDMEDSSTTGATLGVFLRLLEKYKNLRIALQACLFRTADDLKLLVERGSSVRLVKGAYDEPADVAWKSRKDVDSSYSGLVKACFSAEAKVSGFYPAFATHDHDLIEEVLSEASSQSDPGQPFEFQMLLGVRRDWQRKIVEKGHGLRIYVPFGSHWYPYFMRRLAERPANVLFLIRALLSP